MVVQAKLRANFYSIKTLPLFNYSYKTITSQPRIILDFGISKDDPSADLYFRSIIENGWLEWHTVFTDASKLSEAECVGIGTFHSQYNIVQKVKYPPKTRCLLGNVVLFWKPLSTPFY
ncbi:hypothetical protein EVAR_85073_1 [Eumeta japonica]|uniref:Uncharacterized protein n=1 Tax=Eumeta variegata TaxID=151549 RepID=A0A4C1XCY1_EUMVA|nr:hypothetical protein EVAR_85073_1 [Eumeta japonica]